VRARPGIEIGTVETAAEDLKIRMGAADLCVGEPQIAVLTAAHDERRAIP
jgi:hypothetical protein